MTNNELTQDSHAEEEEESLFVQGPSTMANSQVVQANHTVAPAVAGAVGHVCKFQIDSIYLPHNLYSPPPSLKENK